MLIDANILLYAYIQSFDQHEAAHAWLDDQLNGSARIGLPWESLLAFVRLATNPRLFVPAVRTATAWQQVLNWLACDTTWIPLPTERHSDRVGELLALPGVQGKLVPDAHLAALAIEHGLTLCSSDGDFARFPGLKWINPLVA